MLSSLTSQSVAGLVWQGRAAQYYQGLGCGTEPIQMRTITQSLQCIVCGHFDPLRTKILFVHSAVVLLSLGISPLICSHMLQHPSTYHQLMRVVVDVHVIEVHNNIIPEDARHLF